MRLNPLGNSGLRVSALGLGTMNFGSDWHGTGLVDERTADRLIGQALDAGVNLIDTADIYGYGASEELLGRVLGARRKQVLLATKVLGRMRPDDPASGGLGRRHIEEAIEDSLRRLRTEWLDLYMPHAWDRSVRPEESVEAFERARKAGKIRVLGVSNFNGYELRRWWEAGGRPHFNQVQYSLSARFIERDALPVCREGGVSVMAWSPLGGGLLTGKYAGKKRPDGRRKHAAKAFPPLPEADLAGLVARLGDAARALKATPAQAALGWVLSKTEVACAVVGARTQEQLAETLKARALDLRSLDFLERAPA